MLGPATLPLAPRGSSNERGPSRQKKDPAGRHPAGSARPGRGTENSSRSLVVVLVLHADEGSFERVCVELEGGAAALDLVHAPPDPKRRANLLTLEVGVARITSRKACHGV